MGRNVVVFLRDKCGVTKEDFKSLMEVSEYDMEAKVKTLVGDHQGLELNRTLDFVRVMRQIG